MRTTFSVPDFGVAFGEHLRLVGSTPAMGDWTTNEGLALEWNEGNNWTASAELPAGPIEFKVLREYLSNMVDEEKSSQPSIITIIQHDIHIGMSPARSAQPGLRTSSG